MTHQSFSFFKLCVATAATIVATLAINSGNRDSFAAAKPVAVPQSLSSATDISQQDADLPQIEPARSQPQSITPQPQSVPTPAVPALAAPPATTLEQPAFIVNDYVLGAGDQMRIEAFGAPEYSGEAVVLSDGTISLPITGRIAVGGLTIAAATEAITAQYTPYLRNPRISIALTDLRPVRVGVVGAVKRPGTYTVPIEENGATNFPTLTDALRIAGGISAQADIRQLRVYRRSQAGSETALSVNLWELLQSGNMSEDILLRSGDTVEVPVASAISPAEANQLGSASFAPDVVTVYVVGEVNRPGPIQLPPNTPLNQALLAAGGFDTQRANDDKIGLIRLNADGSVQQRAIAVDLSASVNEENNPLLREEDVLVVERSGLASFSDTAGLAVNPIGRLLNGIFNIFDFLD